MWFLGQHYKTTKLNNLSWIDAFELWCWRRLLRVPWTTRRSNQSILKEINPEYSLKELLLKLKFQYFGSLLWRANSLEKTLMLRKIEAGEGDDRRRDGGMASLTQWTWDWASSRRWWRTGKPGVLQSRGSQRVGHDWATDQQQHCIYLLKIKLNVILTESDFEFQSHLMAHTD